jgi:hypothetical protein
MSSASDPLGSPQAARGSRLAGWNFGRLDAESDENLLNYFLDTGIVGRIRDEGAKLVIGRKGSGKTALFRYLEQHLDAVVVPLDLDEYVWELHRGFTEHGLAGERAYAASWRLLIYVSAVSALADRLESDEAKRVKAALADLGVSADSGRVRAILGWLKRVRRVDLPEVTGIASAGGLELEAPEVGALSTKTADAIRSLGEVLAEVCRRTPFVVLIDRLDDAWDGSEESLHLIAGAIRATRDVGISHKNSGGLPPVVSFLRADLWERVSFNDRNKMSQDIVFLDWEADQLAEVVALRIATSLGVSSEDAWAEVFTTDEMRQRARAKTYLTKRTLGRPRDIVAFAEFSRQVAAGSGAEIIDAASIYEAERRYSRHILDELKDELDRHVADFNAVTNALKALGTRTFNEDAWIAACKSNGIPTRQASGLLDALFETSIVGMHATGGAKGGSGTVYRYEDRHLRPTGGATLQVHLALVKELGLTDA